jgi:hypothetical protein
MSLSYLVLLVSIVLIKFDEEYELWGMEKDFPTVCSNEELGFNSRQGNKFFVPSRKGRSAVEVIPPPIKLVMVDLS